MLGKKEQASPPARVQHPTPGEPKLQQGGKEHGGAATTERAATGGWVPTAPPLLFSFVPAPFFLDNKVVFFCCLFVFVGGVRFLFFSFSGKHSEMLVHQAQDLKYFDVRRGFFDCFCFLLFSR